MGGRNPRQAGHHVTLRERLEACKVLAMVKGETIQSENCTYWLQRWSAMDPHLRNIVVQAAESWRDGHIAHMPKVLKHP